MCLLVADLLACQAFRNSLAVRFAMMEHWWWQPMEERGEGTARKMGGAVLPYLSPKTTPTLLKVLFQAKPGTRTQTNPQQVLNFQKAMCFFC